MFKIMDRKNHGDEINPKRNLIDRSILEKDSSSEDDDDDEEENYEDASSQGTTISDKDPLSGDDEGPNIYPLYQSKRPPVKIPPLYLTEAEVEDFFRNQSEISSSDEGSPGSNDAKRLDKKEKQKVEKKASMTLEERKAADKREVKFPQNLYKNRNKPPRGFAKGFEAKIIKPPNKSRPLKRNMEQSKYKAAWDKYDKEIKEENMRYDEWKKENSNRNPQERYDPGMEATRIMTRIAKGRNPIPIDKPPSTSIERMNRNLIRAIAASPNAKQIETDRTRIAAARPNNDDKASDDRRKNNVRANVITLTVSKGYRLDVPPKVQCGPHSDLVRTEYRIKRKLSDETKKRIEDERTSSKKRDDRDSSSKEREINNKSFDSDLEDTLLSLPPSPHKDSPIQSTSKMAYQQQQQQKSDSDKKKIVDKTASILQKFAIINKKRGQKSATKIEKEIAEMIQRIKENVPEDSRSPLFAKKMNGIADIGSEEALEKSEYNNLPAVEVLIRQSDNRIDDTHVNRHNTDPHELIHNTVQERVLDYLSSSLSAPMIVEESNTISKDLLNDVRITLEEGTRRLRVALPERLTRYITFLSAKTKKSAAEKKHINDYNSYVYDFMLGLMSAVLRHSFVVRSIQPSADQEDRDYSRVGDANPVSIADIIESLCEEFKDYLIKLKHIQTPSTGKESVDDPLSSRKTRSNIKRMSDEKKSSANKNVTEKEKVVKKKINILPPVSPSLDPGRTDTITVDELIRFGIQDTVFRRLVNLRMDQPMPLSVPNSRINVEDASRLIPEEWLNDEVVNVGFGLVGVDLSTPENRIEIIDIGYANLMATRQLRDYTALRNRIIGARHVLVPLNITLDSGAGHYILMYADTLNKTWSLYDPQIEHGRAFGNNGGFMIYGQDAADRIYEYIRALDIALTFVTGVSFDTSILLANRTLMMADDSRLIHQLDGSSCGALVIHAARTLVDPTYRLDESLARYNFKLTNTDRKNKKIVKKVCPHTDVRIDILERIIHSNEIRMDNLLDQPITSGSESDAAHTSDSDDDLFVEITSNVNKDAKNEGLRDIRKETDDDEDDNTQL